MAAMNRSMVVAGIITLFQSIGQMMFTSLGLFQYFCIIDFLRELPLLLFIKILYFHNPSTCGISINIGQSIEGMANQAFVLLSEEPFTSTRTFYINSISLGLSVLWFPSCIGLMRGGARNKQTKHIRWPWIIVTVMVCAVDLTATVIYANDFFHTRTLSDTIDFIGGITSGTGSAQVNTSWAAWTMVILYSRFVFLFILNLVLVVVVVIDVGSKRIFVENTAVQVEEAVVTNETNTWHEAEDDFHSSPSETPVPMLPRPGLRLSFRQMKERLFKRDPTTHLPPIHQSTSPPRSLGGSPERSPRLQHNELDKKRTVNFPANLMSPPQRLENLIAEQSKRLEGAVVDTSGRQSPPRASQTLPHLTPPSVVSRGRRSTVSELQSQLPWAYIPASNLPMRNQLPPDEDLPPVPLPDYTTIPSARKTWNTNVAAFTIKEFSHEVRHTMGGGNKSRRTNIADSADPQTPVSNWESCLNELFPSRCMAVPLILMYLSAEMWRTVILMAHLRDTSKHKCLRGGPSYLKIRAITILSLGICAIVVFEVHALEEVLGGWIPPSKHILVHENHQDFGKKCRNLEQHKITRGTKFHDCHALVISLEQKDCSKFLTQILAVIKSHQEQEALLQAHVPRELQWHKF